MGFSINPHHLPTFRDYNKADAWEKEVKPIRGKQSSRSVTGGINNWRYSGMGKAPQRSG